MNDSDLSSSSDSSISSISSIPSDTSISSGLSDYDTADSSSGSSMSSRITRRSAAAILMSHDSDTSTEDYDIPRPRARDSLENIIEINDTQPLAPIDNNVDDDDDDVVLIPDEVVTIDLCTQAIPAAVPNDLNNQVIDITDSPAANENQPRGRRSGDAGQPTRASRRNIARTSPYGSGGPSTSKNTSTPKQKPKQPQLNDSQEPLLYTCPICLESVKKRQPVTTMCGHVFCKECIKSAITATSKKCPMCKKNLTGKTPFIQIFID